MGIVKMDDEWIYQMSPWGSGAAHSVSYDSEEQSAVDRLRAVVEEVTGKPAQKPQPKIGFY